MWDWRAAMRQLYVALRVGLVTLLALCENAPAETGCHLPKESEIISLITTTYTSNPNPGMTVNLTRTQYSCLASSMYQDKYRSASLLVQYTCTPPIATTRCVIRENYKELLDLSCVDGEWSVANFTKNPGAKFNRTPRTDCSSCVSPTELPNTSFYDAASHCVECSTECNTSTGAGRCFGRGEDECCNFYGHWGECLQDCDHVEANFNCRGFSCYESNDCTGPGDSIVYTGRDCCAKTMYGHSYDANGECKQCIVHGFNCLNYEVNEGSDLNTTFHHNVKGRSQQQMLPRLDGFITIVPVTKILSHFKKIDAHTNIHLSISHLEANDTLKMKFKSTLIDNFVEVLESHGQFIQDTAIVTIVPIVQAVELENTFYNVNIDMDEVEVCAVIKMTCDCYDSCGCPITFSFNVTLTLKGAESSDYSKPMVFAPCDMKSCVTISIENDLGITTTQTVDVILGSTDDRITLKQTNGNIEIHRAPSRNQSVDLGDHGSRNYLSIVGPVAGVISALILVMIIIAITLLGLVLKYHSKKHFHVSGGGTATQSSDYDIVTTDPHVPPSIPPTPQPTNGDVVYEQVY